MGDLPTTREYLATIARTKLAMADASGAFTDDQLQRNFQLTPAKLAAERDDPAYRALVDEQIAQFQASCASRYFKLQMLADTALDNAETYLRHQDDKYKVDMTKFVLSKILPNPEQRVAVSGAATPSITVEASVVLNERLLQLRGTLPPADVERVAIEDDPHLQRPSQ